VVFWLVAGGEFKEEGKVGGARPRTRARPAGAAAEATGQATMCARQCGIHEPRCYSSIGWPAGRGSVLMAAKHGRVACGASSSASSSRRD
jgi:hypothetical protein